MRASAYRASDAFAECPTNAPLSRKEWKVPYPAVRSSLSDSSSLALPLMLGRCRLCRSIPRPQTILSPASAISHSALKSSASAIPTDRITRPQQRVSYTRSARVVVGDTFRAKALHMLDRLDTTVSERFIEDSVSKT